MEVRTGYKQTEVEVIPEDWEVKPLGSLCRITTGHKDVNEGNPAGRFPFFTCSRSITYSDSYSFDTEAILIAGNGDVGTRHYYKGKFEAYQRTYVLDKFRLNIHYIDQYLERCLIPTLSIDKIGSSIPYIKLSNLRDFPIASPTDDNEISAIATVLGEVDALIDTLIRRIAKKRDLKQAAMQQLLTGQTRLPGFNGDWERKDLGDLGATYGGLTGKTKSDFGVGTARYITFLNILNNVVIDPEEFELVRVRSFEKQNQALKGDLFFNGSSETPEEVGMCSILQAEVRNVFLNSFCFGFRLHEGAKDHGIFLAHYFRSDAGRELLYSLAQGATRYNLSKISLLKLSFLLPEPDEQAAIAAVLSDMDAEVAALKARLAKIQSLKQGMMQELLTGRIRLI